MIPEWYRGFAAWCLTPTSSPPQGLPTSTRASSAAPSSRPSATAATTAGAVAAASALSARSIGASALRWCRALALGGAPWGLAVGAGHTTTIMAICCTPCCSCPSFELATSSVVC
jgi:hypothetical protein